MPTVLMVNDTGKKIPVNVSEEIMQQIREGQKHFVLAKNLEGAYVPVEVSSAIYQLFVQEYRFHQRVRNEHRGHLDDRELDDYAIVCQAITEHLENEYLHRERLQEIYTILQSCTPIQRERFYLSKVCGYSYREIATRHECSIPNVYYSVKAVIKKFKKFFEEGT